MLREAHVKRQGFICSYCVDPLTQDTATLDHRKPWSQGGRNSRKNTVACCAHCNNTKSDMPEREFREAIKSPQRDHPLKIWMIHSRRRINIALLQQEFKFGLTDVQFIPWHGRLK